MSAKRELNLQSVSKPSFENERVASFLKLASRLDWEVQSVTELGVYLRKRKSYGQGYLVLGAATAIFLIGFLVWFVGLIDYLSSKDRLLFVPIADLDGDRAIKTADLLV